MADRESNPAFKRKPLGETAYESEEEEQEEERKKKSACVKGKEKRKKERSSLVFVLVAGRRASIGFLETPLRNPETP